MRRLLTGGIKAILAIAALATATHWVLRLQREPTPSARVLAELADPVTTGSITPRKGEAAESAVEHPDVTKGLDQRGLSALFEGAKLQKAAAKR
ncbi:hypothetical protein [Methylobacterium sp.]|jgi:hypothetical protein|uniref:hypothetical protein n=1 Tax=Methylobacterium sp. TaxID=409 RepID=UPI0025D8D38D|nr:hypothetical protein [Methylobacterium sp.]MBY0258153.1 hypothetical protein [Methylobacterium sp.]